MAEVTAAVPALEGRWRSLAVIYRAVIRNAMLYSLQYRVNALIETVLYLAQPVVFMMVWQIVARERGGEVGGYTVGRIAAYYVAWGLVGVFTQSGSPLNWEGWVRRGEMSGMLMRPIHPAHQDLARWIGFGSIRAVFWLPAGVMMTVAFRPDVDTGMLQLAVFPLALGMAFLIRTLLSDTVGASAFWLTRIGAVANLTAVLDLTASGRMFPPDVMPGWAQTVTAALPWRWTFAFPIEVLIGPISTADMLVGLGVQAFWLLIIWALFLSVWRLGVRQYSAVGG